jgi:Acetyltransferases
MNIRTATIEDLAAIAAVEAMCFPETEAAGINEFEKRLRVYPEHFWLLEQNGELIGFIDGMVTNELTIRDEMFENAQLHNEAGDWQTIFGVNTVPGYRRKGCAARLMEQVIADARAQERKGCILTCKEELIRYYEKFGYQKEGLSRSVHGGAVWYDMKLVF